MKKLLRPYPLIIGATLLVFLGFCLAPILCRDPLRADRADGQEIRILKWEIAEESAYDMRSRWDHAKLWLSTKTPLKKIWPPGPREIFDLRPFYLNTDFPQKQSTTPKQKALFVWYSLGKKGHHPQFTNNGRSQGPIYLSSQQNAYGSLSKENIQLLDHHGVRYATGWSCSISRAGAITIHTLVFTAFNATSPNFQLLMRDTGTWDSKDWFRFTLDNPSPQPPASAQPDTTPLPVRRDLGAFTIQLNALPRSSDNPHRFQPEFHFEKDGLPADELITVNAWEVFDPDGGREGNVSSHAAEWIIRGTVIPRHFANIPAHRKQAHPVSPPQPLSCQPFPSMDIGNGTTNVWLVGPGAYLFDHTGLIQKADLNEAKSLEAPFEAFFSKVAAQSHYSAKKRPSLRNPDVETARPLRTATRPARRSRQTHPVDFAR